MATLSPRAAEDGTTQTILDAVADPSTGTTVSSVVKSPAKLGLQFIEFLDDLRDAMWEIYYDDIFEMHQAIIHGQSEDDGQLCFEFYEEDKF